MVLSMLATFLFPNVIYRFRKVPSVCQSVVETRCRFLCKRPWPHFWFFIFQAARPFQRPEVRHLFESVYIYKTCAEMQFPLKELAPFRSSSIIWIILTFLNESNHKDDRMLNLCLSSKGYCRVCTYTHRSNFLHRRDETRLRL